MASTDPFIVSADCREQSDEVLPLIRGVNRRCAHTRFASVDAIRLLRTKHALGNVPWLVTNIDTGHTEILQ